jgi:SlyX protein
METRLTDLESRYMHQERTIQELNEAVYRQEQIIDRLEREVRELREQLTVMLPSLNRSSADEEPPPHY